MAEVASSGQGRAGVGTTLSRPIYFGIHTKIEPLPKSCMSTSFLRRRAGSNSYLRNISRQSLQWLENDIINFLRSFSPTAG